MKRITHSILKSGQTLKLNLANRFANSHGYNAASVSSLLDENETLVFFGREQHYVGQDNSKTKALNYYVLRNRNWEAMNSDLTDIYLKEVKLRFENVKRKEELNLEAIKSFNQRIWFDLSKQSNAIEGVFADYNLTPVEFEKKLGEMIHITSPSCRVFDYSAYFCELRKIQEIIQQQEESKRVVRGRKKEHPISKELIRHYIAFKYAYKCARMFSITNSIKNMRDVEKLLDMHPEIAKEFEGLDKGTICKKIAFTPANVLEMTNNFIALLTGQDYVPYRREQAYVTLYGDRDFAGWVPVSENRVLGQLESWAKWVVNEKCLHPIEKAAIAQAEFIRIHPYGDGNGRTSRIIANFILMVNDLPTVQVRGYEEDEKDSSKVQPMGYFCALNKAIREHDANDLIDLFYRGMWESIECVKDSLDVIERETEIEYSIEQKAGEGK